MLPRANSLGRRNEVDNQQERVAEPRDTPLTNAFWRNYTPGAGDQKDPITMMRDLERAAAGAVSRMNEAVKSTPPQPEPRVDRIDHDAAQRLLAFFGNDEGEVTVARIEHGHSGPGLYAWFTEYPEEGSIPLFDGKASTTDEAPSQ
jgi:hypothetical protein